MLEAGLFIGVVLLWFFFGLMADYENNKPKADAEENINKKEGKRHV